MKVWQIILIVLAAITLLVGVIVGGVFYATSGITDAGDEFFDAARRGDYEAAYALTSTELRNDSGVAGLQGYLVANDLDKVTDTSWSSRSIENNVGRLEGSVTTESGGTIPLTMRLVKEKGGWKIAMVETMRSGLSTGGDLADPDAVGGSRRTVAQIAAEDPDIPPPHTLHYIVRIMTSHMQSRAEDGDMAWFLEKWVDGTTASEVAPVWDTLRNNPDLMETLEDVRPVVEDVRRTEEGYLDIRATFPNAKGDVGVTYRVVPDGDFWKVADMQLDY